MKEGGVLDVYRELIDWCLQKLIDWSMFSGDCVAD